MAIRTRVGAHSSLARAERIALQPCKPDAEMPRRISDSTRSEEPEELEVDLLLF
jgi:hypothetical protein